jgi:hypothetical protein
MKKGLALSLIVALMLMSTSVALAKSHQKKSDEIASSSTEVKAHGKKHNRRDKTAETAAATDEPKPSKHKSRKRHIAALPRDEETKANDKQQSESAAREKNLHCGLLGRIFGRQHDDNSDSSSTVESEPIGNHAGMVYVHGYTRKDGTVVHGYWRHKPNSK